MYSPTIPKSQFYVFILIDRKYHTVSLHQTFQSAYDRMCTDNSGELSIEEIDSGEFFVDYEVRSITDRKLMDYCGKIPLMCYSIERCLLTYDSDSTLLSYNAVDRYIKEYAEMENTKRRKSLIN